MSSLLIKLAKEVGKKDSDAKKMLTHPATLGVAAGSAALGASHIDLRPNLLQKRIRHLGDTMQDVKGKLKIGDVLIGSSTGAGAAYKREFKDFVRTFSQLRRGGKSIPQAFGSATGQIGVGSLISKISDPEHSHSAVVVSKNRQAWGGGEVGLLSDEIAANKKTLQFLKKTNEIPHYIILRPNKRSANLLQQYSSRHGTRKTLKMIRKRIGETSHKKEYDFVQAGKAFLKDNLLPKLNRSEVAKPLSQIKREQCLTGGVCSTLGGTLTTRTVGGKNALDIVPKDFLRSKDFKVIGTVGQVKTPYYVKLPLKVPSLIAKGVAAGTIALGTAGAAYGIRGLMKRREMKKESSFANPVRSAFAVTVSDSARTAARSLFR